MVWSRYYPRICLANLNQAGRFWLVRTKYFIKTNHILYSYSKRPGPLVLFNENGGRQSERGSQTEILFLISYLPTYLPTHLPAYLPTYLPTYRPTYLPTYSPTCLTTYLPTYLYSYLPTCLLACLPACLHRALQSFCWTLAAFSVS
jgi:hypothetical protein